MCGELLISPESAIRNTQAGHGRLLAARQLGLTEIPTIVMDHLSEAQKRAFMIAENKLTENAEWNLQLLSEQMRDLSLLDLDFDIEITGNDNVIRAVPSPHRTLVR